MSSCLTELLVFSTTITAVSEEEEEEEEEEGKKEVSMCELISLRCF